MTLIRKEREKTDKESEARSSRPNRPGREACMSSFPGQSGARFIS